MANFGIDEDMITDIVGKALESAGAQLSQEKFQQIAEAIDNGMPGVIEILTYGIQEHWKAEARNTPTGWGEKYAAAIKAKVTGNKGTVFVDPQSVDKASNKPASMFVDMVERGMKSFDIKKALLASDKAKVSADGIRYIVIPFPVATPRKKSQGKMASKFGGREMTEEIHKIVKSGGKIKSGKLESGQDVSGLTRYVTRQRHSQYGIFRIITKDSKGWIHPGVAPSPVFPSVVSEVNRRVGEVVSEFVKAIVSEYTM